jgi:hypothetical protein
LFAHSFSTSLIEVFISGLSAWPTAAADATAAPTVCTGPVATSAQ